MEGLRADLAVTGEEIFSLLCFLFYLITILWILNFQIANFCKDNSKELGTKTVPLPLRAALESSAEMYHTSIWKLIMP